MTERSARFGTHTFRQAWAEPNSVIKGTEITITIFFNHKINCQFKDNIPSLLFLQVDIPPLRLFPDSGIAVLLFFLLLFFFVFRGGQLRFVFLLQLLSSNLLGIALGVVPADKGDEIYLT